MPGSCAAKRILMPNWTPGANDRLQKSLLRHDQLASHRCGAPAKHGGVAKMGHFRLKRRIGTVPGSGECRASSTPMFAPFQATRPGPYPADPADQSLPRARSSTPGSLMLGGHRRYCATGNRASAGTRQTPGRLVSDGRPAASNKIPIVPKENSIIAITRDENRSLLVSGYDIIWRVLLAPRQAAAYGRS